MEFVTAIAEAFANAVEHANSEGPVRISCMLVGGQLRATIVDRGSGIPSDRTIPPDRLPDAWSERGRGLPLMRRFSDHLSVRSRPGRGTTVVIERSLRVREHEGAFAS
jgi:anti-sigma regulatory factor (Ser/Thr protein kinase)